MTVKPPAPPPLPDELNQLLRRMRLPYIRRAAPRSDRQRDCPALGARRGSACAARRRSQRPPTGDNSDPAARIQGFRPAKRSTRGSPATSNPPKTQRALQTLEWIDRAEVLVVCGPSGTGKSHLVEALGHLAIDNGKIVAWHTLETPLAQLLRRRRAADSINKAIGKLIRADLVVVDDVGLRRRGADGRPRALVHV